MERIKFIDFNKRKPWMIILLVSLILIIIGAFEPFEISKAAYKYINVIGFSLMSVHYLGMYNGMWYKNLVTWNKKGITFKFKSNKAGQLSFSEIEKVDFSDKLMTIVSKNGTKTLLNLSHISELDSNKQLNAQLPAH